MGRKVTWIEKICPVCNTGFSVPPHGSRKVTCSRKCSNTHFRSGPSNGNWNDDSYRSTCFHHHKKKCVVCNESNIVEVHHFDEDKSNNAPENLIPLCPTHHQYWHSRFRSQVEDKIIQFRNNFLQGVA